MGRKDDMLNKVGYNNNGERMTIVRYGGARDIDVQFDDGTIVEHKQYDNFKKGSIKNPMTPSLFGVGFMGKGRFKSKDANGKETKCYMTWRGMMQRCYNPTQQEKRPRYKGCTVCEEWWNFQVFAEWYYSHFYEIENEIMALDKDILCKGNKVYSPNTCVFVPVSVNSLFVKCDNSRGNYPIGTCKHKDKFEVFLCKGDRRMYLGLYDTPEEAFQAYKHAKEQYIKEVANEYKDKIDPRAYEALMNYEVEIDD